MNKSRNPFFYLLLFIPFALFAQGQNNTANLLFSHLTTKNGLSYNEVTCVFKDSRGFIWVGTKDGLNRYDASSVKNFYHYSSQPHSIAGNYIAQIAEDHYGSLWVATDGGVSKMDSRTENFENFQHTDSVKSSLVFNKCNTLIVDNDGVVFVGTDNGLDAFDSLHHHFIHYRNECETTAEAIKWSNFIGRVFQDAEHRVWICTQSGLYQFEKKSGQFKKYAAPVTYANSVIDNLCTDIFEDHLHQLWVSTWGGGLKKFDPQMGKFETFKWEKNPEISSAANIAHAINESKDRYGNYHLWIATANGLAEFNRQGNFFTFYKNVPSNNNTISSNYAAMVYTDNAGLLWVATSLGLNILDPDMQFFTTHQFDGATYGSAAKYFGAINCLLCEKKNIWVTTWYGNGLYKFDKHFNLIKSWYKIPPSASNPDNHQVSNIVRDGNVLWLSTFNGLVKFDDEKNTFKLYLPDSTQKGNIPKEKVIRMFIDSHGLHWVFFYRGGFAWFYPEKDYFVSAGETIAGKPVKYVAYDVAEDNTGNVWIACDSFLLRYDRAANSFSRLKAPGKIPSCQVLCLMKDHTGKIWAGTKAGISVIDPVTFNTHFIRLEDGLSNENITGILEDKKYRVWIATMNGLDFFDPTTGKIGIYRKDNGLETDDLDIAFCASDDGRFLFGGTDYITEFYPDSLSYNNVVPPVVITSLKILGTAVPLPAYEDKGKRTVTLSYKQNEFEFGFSVLNYTDPDANTFFCKMEGFDNNWRQFKKGAVSYTNLDPGEYIFRVKGANNDGIINATGDYIRVVITPPLWKTWWFRIAVLVAVLLLMFGFTRYRVNRVRKEEEQKAEFSRRLSEMRVQALRTQMNPHFIFNSLNAIEGCIEQHKNREAGAYLSKFSKLVRVILENFSKERVTLTREIEMLRLYLEMEALRFTSDFNYELNVDPDLETDLIQIPTMLIQPYIENAIWHGLVHSDGVKKLAVTFKEVDNVLKVTIDDNGIGRDAAQKLKQKNMSSREPVAMKNTEERLKLLNADARIEIEDMKDGSGKPAGTQVIITIPLT